MSKDLTISTIERQNVLNNKYALETIITHLDVPGMLFEGEYRFTKKMVADFYEVEERTIERYIEKNGNELSANGYILCKGKQLKELKLQFAPVINVGSKTTQLGLFNFRSFLNIGMLLTESEKAKEIRSVILDMVLESINQKTGSNPIPPKQAARPLRRFFVFKRAFQGTPSKYGKNGKKQGTNW